MRTFALTCLCLTIAALPVHAKIYKWTDSNGQVHFSDNRGGVPPEYLEQTQERNSRPPAAQQSTHEIPYASSRSSSNSPPPSAQHYLVPLYRIGNAMLVDVVINGFMKSRLLVDTGAALTVISTAAAKQLGLNLTDAAVIPLRSVSGLFLAPLTKVRSITVGDVTVRDVEVVVHDIASGGGMGLLGMSFMDNFQVTMNVNEEMMILTALSNTSDKHRYGGRTEDWWRRKFRFYRRQIESIEAYVKQRPTDQFDKTLRYFRAELMDLDRKANHAAVPRQWRY